MNKKLIYAGSLYTIVTIVIALYFPALSPVAFLAFLPSLHFFFTTKSPGYLFLLVLGVIVTASLFLPGLHYRFQVIAGLCRYGFWLLLFQAIGPKIKLPAIAVLIVLMGADYYLIWLLPSGNHFFIADLLAFPGLIHWNETTGYLATTAWILGVNWFAYKTLVAVNARQRWLQGLLGLSLLIIPAIISVKMPNIGIDHDIMYANYRQEDLAGRPCYSLHGELIARTCAWMSILILIFTFVKSYTLPVRLKKD